MRHTEGRPRGLTRCALAVCLGAVCLAPPLGAIGRSREGHYAPAVSTWDTRASSISLSGQFLNVGDDTRVRHATYSTNFTSTSGQLSSQLAVHYVHRQVGDEPGEQGAAGSAVTMFHVSILDRHHTGLPPLGLAVYFGPLPQVLMSRQLASISLPLVAGLGLTWSPASWLTVTPWGEVAPSYEVWAEPQPYTLALDVPAEGTDDPNAEPPAEEIDLTVDDVGNVLRDAVAWRRGWFFAWRAGLTLESHVGPHIDLRVQAAAASAAYGRARAVGLATVVSLLWHWDAVVPAVLPEAPPRCPPTGAAVPPPWAATPAALMGTR